MRHAFISYIREDQAMVDRLCQELRARNVEVWLDRDCIDPGQNWQQAVRSAIEHGAFFLACFSTAYTNREETYMHDELSLAVDVLSNSKEHTDWFIPIKLTECQIPDLRIGTRQSLRDIQWVDLHTDWDRGILHLLKVVRPPTYLDPVAEREFRDFFTRYIDTKIALNRTQGAWSVLDVEQRWKALLDPLRWNKTAELVFQLMAKCRSFHSPVTDRLFDPLQDGCDVLVTVSPSDDPKQIMQSLLRAEQLSERPYLEFIRRERKRMRTQDHWEKKDLAHWFLMIDTQAREWVLDMFFLLNSELSMVLVGYRESKREEGVILPFWGSIYPTSLMSALEAEEIQLAILNDEAQTFNKAALQQHRSWWEFWK